MHEHAYRIRKLGNGAFRFETPDGADLAHPVPTVSPSDLPSIDTEHADVEPTAATTKWDGQRMQRDHAISVIAARRYSTTG